MGGAEQELSHRADRGFHLHGRSVQPRVDGPQQPGRATRRRCAGLPRRQRLGEGAMDFDTLLFEADGGIATLTINRPEKRNAWSARLSEEIVEAFGAIEADRDLRVTILTGAGDKAFSAGADLGDERTHRVSNVGNHLATVTPRGHDVFNAVADHAKPIIAA